MKPLTTNWKVIIAGLFFSAMMLSACGQQAQPTPEESGIPLVTDVLAVIVDGRLNPARSVHLSFKNGGEIGDVLVVEGDQVQSGDVLIRLADGAQLRAAATAAELELVSAELSIQALYDGAALKAAQAQLDLAKARDALRDAERSWQNQQEGYRASSVTIKAAEAELELAESVMEQTKRQYDSYSGRSSDDPVRAQAYKNYAAAYQRYQTALRNVNWYTGHPTEIQQAILDANVALARAQLENDEQDWLDWSEGPDADELLLAETRLANAQAQLESAEAALAALEIVAPFSGTVARLSIQEGELAAPGQAAMVLADFSSWKVDTENLTEIDMPQIVLGNSVQVDFDAFPELSLAGVVSAISPVYEMKSGDVTYTVEIELLDTFDGLQWGMTTVVTFDESATKAAQIEPARIGLGH
jgi:multidrug resistance efflux pump